MVSSKSATRTRIEVSKTIACLPCLCLLAIACWTQPETVEKGLAQSRFQGTATVGAFSVGSPLNPDTQPFTTSYEAFEEEMGHASDGEYPASRAASLQTIGTMQGLSQEERDAQLARELQEEEDSRAELVRSNIRVLATYQNQASRLIASCIQRVDGVLSSHHRGGALPSSVQHFPKNDVVFLAQVMLATRQMFRRMGKPCRIDMGYISTSRDRVSDIRTTGLVGEMTCKASYGEDAPFGLYTTDGPILGRNCPEEGTGLLVARLRGRSAVAVQSSTSPGLSLSFPSEQDPYDSIIVPHHRTTDAYERTYSDGDFRDVVLMNPSQCLPLVLFSSPDVAERSPTGDSPCIRLVRKVQVALQQVMDESCNSSHSQTTDSSHQPTQPVELPAQEDTECLVYVCPDSLNDSDNPLDVAPITRPSPSSSWQSDA